MSDEKPMLLKPKFAALTAGLLARKGEAAPASTIASADDLGPIARGFVRQPGGLSPYRPHHSHHHAAAPAPVPRQPVTSVADIQMALEVALKEAPLVPPAAETPAPKPAPKETAGEEAGPKTCEGCPGESSEEKRFHISVRLRRSRYLKLKLAAATLHKPSQDIIGEALDAYFEKLGEDVLGTCPCVGK